MPSSPRTPRHSRHTSTSELSLATPLAHGHISQSRRQSKSSIHSPTTPHRPNYNRSDSVGGDPFSSGGAPPSNGLGSLADELADAWGDDEGEDDDEPDMNFQEAPEEGETIRDSGVDVEEQPPPKSATLTTPGGNRGHQRQPSEYDGSDYGGHSDLEPPGLPAGLVSRIDLVESLARRGTESTGGEQDNVVKRVVDGLKDLGGQSGVEGGATRYIFPKEVPEDVY